MKQLKERCTLEKPAQSSTFHFENKLYKNAPGAVMLFLCSVLIDTNRFFFFVFRFVSFYNIVKLLLRRQIMNNDAKYEL